MSTQQQDELQRFKREIDLTRYAVIQGFHKDRRKSWNGTTALRRGKDLIFVKRNSNGHFVFWSPLDEKRAGTIIDFVQRENGCDLGAVRRELRQWL